MLPIEVLSRWIERASLQQLVYLRFNWLGGALIQFAQDMVTRKERRKIPTALPTDDDRTNPPWNNGWPITLSVHTHILHFKEPIEVTIEDWNRALE
jgi:hypothetical protein